MIMPCSNTQLELDHDRPSLFHFDDPDTVFCVECDEYFERSGMKSISAIGDEGCCRQCFTEANGYV